MGREERPFELRAWAVSIDEAREAVATYRKGMSG